MLESKANIGEKHKKERGAAMRLGNAEGFLLASLISGLIGCSMTTVSLYIMDIDNPATPKVFFLGAGFGVLMAIFLAKFISANYASDKSSEVQR